MTWNDDAGQWDHEDPPEPDYDTWERDQLARDDEDECRLCFNPIVAIHDVYCDDCAGWHDDDDPGPDEETDE